MTEYYNNNANRYQFLGVIGKDRLADIYAAKDLMGQKEVAIKVLHTENLSPEFLQYFNGRFPQDAGQVARLNHPNIVKIFDFTILNNAPAWVMERLSGQSYQQFCGQQLPEAQAAAMLAPVADALAYAHQFGVVHGNLKPFDILLNNMNQPVLTGFAETRWLSEPGHSFGNFEANAGIGSPEYLAPEQAQGMPVDGRTDVYSLGVILYELITGRKPFSSVSPMETMIHQVNDQLPSPRYFVPNVSPNMEQLLYRAMAKNPAERISMAEFSQMLRSFSGAMPQNANNGYYPPASYYADTASVGAEDYEDDSEGSFLKKFLASKRNKIILAAAAAVIVAGVVLAVVLGNNAKKAKQEAEYASMTQSVMEMEATQTAVFAEISAEKTAAAEEQGMILRETEAAVESSQLQIIPTAAPLPVYEPETVEVLPTAVPSYMGHYWEQDPNDGVEKIAGEGFTMAFHVINDGNKEWPMTFKLKFVAGTNFAKDQQTEVNIPEIVYGNSWLKVPCQAPWTTGTYTTQWALYDENDNVVIDYLSLTIKVVSGSLTATPDPNAGSSEKSEGVEPTEDFFDFDE